MNNLLAGATRTGKVTNSLFSMGSKVEALGVSYNAGEFLQTYVPNFIGLLFIIGTVSFFMMLLWGAVGWILSGGDKASLESAKNKITNAIIGFILMIATFAIIKIIQKFFGISILSIDIGPLIIR